MAERWQTELSKLRGAELGTDLWDRILEGPRLVDSRPPTRSRSLAAVVALGVFLAAGVLAWDVFRPFERRPPTLAGSNLVRVPARGQAVAVFLPDGRPVFVVHQPDGLVTAVDAISPHRDWGIEQLVAWCPGRLYYVAWPDGSFFHRAGRWWGGRPAPPGLRAVSFEVLSRDARGDPATLRLGEVGPSWGGSHGGMLSQGAFPSACGLANGDLTRVLTHAIAPSKISPSPAAAARADTSEWMAVDGTLLVSEDGTVRLCSTVEGGTCRDGAPVIGLDGPGLLGKLEADPVSRYAQSHLWLVRTHAGAVVELAISPAS